MAATALFVVGRREELCPVSALAQLLLSDTLKLADPRLVVADVSCRTSTVCLSDLAHTKHWIELGPLFGNVLDGIDVGVELHALIIGHVDRAHLYEVE